METLIFLKPFLIAVGLVLTIGGIWGLIHLAMRKALEIDDEEEIKYPNEEDLYL